MNIPISFNFSAPRLGPVPNIMPEKTEFEVTIDTIEESPSALQSHIRFLQRPITPVMNNGEKLHQLLAAGNMDSFINELHSLEARRELTRHAVNTKTKVLQAILPQSSEVAEDITNNVNDQTAAEFETAATTQQLAYYTDLIEQFSASSSDVKSSREIYDMVAEAINVMSIEYLDVFQQAVEKNAAFYRDFTDFISTLRSFITANDDKTILDTENFRNDLETLMATYAVPGLSTTLFPVQTGDSIVGHENRAECEAWARELGLNPELCVKETSAGSGKYIVHIDVSPLQTIHDSIADYPNTMESNSAQWASWQTGLDMQKDTIQTAMQTLTQKYSNANSTFDNVVKILSSTIASLLDTDKGFLHF